MQLLRTGNTVRPKIADYFGVSVDNLLGNGSPTVNKKPPEIISNADIISDGKNIYMIPLLENVSESCYPSISKYRIFIGNTPEYTVFCISIRLDIIRLHKLSHYCDCATQFCDVHLKYET